MQKLDRLFFSFYKIYLPLLLFSREHCLNPRWMYREKIKSFGTWESCIIKCVGYVSVHCPIEQKYFPLCKANCSCSIGNCYFITQYDLFKLTPDIAVVTLGAAISQKQNIPALSQTIVKVYGEVNHFKDNQWNKVSIPVC